jgi:hypothetical protein
MGSVRDHPEAARGSRAGEGSNVSFRLSDVVRSGRIRLFSFPFTPNAILADREVPHSPAFGVRVREDIVRNYDFPPVRGVTAFLSHPISG